MYSPTTRLLTVLEMLQAYKQMSATELAHRLEVSTRTVRRYIVMLQDMGIPVEAERGPYGTYQLQRGHKLPPLMFNDAEAVALTLGLLTIRQFHFPVDGAAVEGALAKTERVMPERLLNQVRGLQAAIHFNVRTPPELRQNEFLAILSTAVQTRQRVMMSYQAFNGSESEREFDPYGIVFNEGYWYVAGYCHLRQDLRTFRLDRITRLEQREQSFERPADFDALSYVMDSLASWPETAQIEVLMKTSLECATQAMPPNFGTLEETAEGVIFRRPTYQMEFTACFLLSLDFHAVIIKPPEFQEMVRRMVQQGHQLLGDTI